jgi:hypothetical protein
LGNCVSLMMHNCFFIVPRNAHGLHQQCTKMCQRFTNEYSGVERIERHRCDKDLRKILLRFEQDLGKILKRMLGESSEKVVAKLHYFRCENNVKMILL